MKPVVRSVTVFTGRISSWTRSEIRSVVEECLTLLDRVRSSLEEAGYSIWSLRISFSEPSPSIYGSIADIVSDYIDGGIFVSLGGFRVRRVTRENILSVVSRGYYLPLYPEGPDDVVEAARMIYPVSLDNPIYGTRIALSLYGGPMESPYFPISTSLGGVRVGLSLLYPGILLKAFLESGLAGVPKCIDSISRGLHDAMPRGISYGIDYSISPWMDESVVPLIEAVSGSRIGLPGFLTGIRTLNSILYNTVSRDPAAIGFNEVMLPYAEDNKLKDAGGRGVVRARDFLLYSTACVAGPDMIVVPPDMNEFISYYRDAYTIAMVKKRPMGIRLIATPQKPGDKIDLDMFGKVTVLQW